MSDFRLRQYAKNATSPPSSSDSRPVVKQAAFESFDSKEEPTSSLYTESQENLLKNWIESRLPTAEELKGKIEEVSPSPPEEEKATISPVELLAEKDKVAKIRPYYKKAGEGSQGFLREGDFSQLEKVARFLMTLPKDNVAEIFKYLDPKEVEAIVRQMIRTDPIKNPVEIYELQKEFKQLAERTKSEPKGGMGMARRMLEVSLGKQEANKILEKVAHADHIPFDFLQTLDDKDIWEILGSESTAVLAVVFNFLNRSQAKFVVNKLPPEKQKDLLLRLGRMEKVHDDILRSLESKIQEKVEKRQLGTGDRVEGREVLASILQYMEPSAEEKLLSSLDLEGETREELDDLLFNTDVILRMVDNDLHNVLKDYSPSEIALLIRGKDLEIKHKLLSNLSKRRQEDVEDEGYALGRVPLKEVDRITRQFLEDLRRRQEAGEITIYRKNEEFVE
jgi:flagellar motor switch protein FliG